VQNATDVVVENAGEGTDTVQSSVSWVLGANLENLTLTGAAAINGTGNGGNNVITGNGAANVLTGGAGDDTYVVQNITDVVVENAGEGTDTVLSSVDYVLPANVENLLLAGSGNISGTGNSGANTIIGNTGANILTGGDGSDIFVFGGAPGGGNVDTILDFASDDLIALSLAAFNGIGTAGGSMDSNAFVLGATALDADDRILYDQGTGCLYYDADGSNGGAAQLFVQLAPGCALTYDSINVLA